MYTLKRQHQVRSECGSALRMNVGTQYMGYVNYRKPGGARYHMYSDPGPHSSGYYRWLGGGSGSRRGQVTPLENVRRTR